MSNRVILFCFAGRRPNMELQLPMVRRILEDDHTAEYHIWNLARTRSDYEYVKSIEGERITVINDLYDDQVPHTHFNEVYETYASKEFSDAVFVKVDDDVIFVEAQRFPRFIEQVESHPEAVISAKVINNGACTPLEYAWWEDFTALGVPILDVHKSFEYWKMSHGHALDDWDSMIQQPMKLISIRNWLSINLIGYTWQMGCRIARQLGRRYQYPYTIAGRDFPANTALGDEGMVNLLPRYIFEGFLAAHLYFGPQRHQITDGELSNVRLRYEKVGRNYLRSH